MSVAFKQVGISFIITLIGQLFNQSDSQGQMVTHTKLIMDYQWIILYERIYILYILNGFIFIIEFWILRGPYIWFDPEFLNSQ